ncbi:hypothetical protein ACPOL_6796 (plasmid) [Acidisarcina polymorpha]|uniref:DUF3108 domain-containing protein n=1 Tax=Acidisarcina polymorpha TaxID=2211140 RepID=A0A2Z5GBI2_9BACT|nr:hypothetical protein [Acidisarcina polymorpha]AXC16006.1 hypothetical protein ACPOL_6796 [Acidisarcina polymorpha]
MEGMLIPGPLWRTSARIIVFVMLAYPTRLSGHSISVRIPEGFSHGYLVLRDVKRTIIASGELTQTVRGKRITSRIVYHFRDGSVDDETTVFLQDGSFRLVQDRHTKKGPSFPHPYTATIDATAQQVIIQEGSKPAETKHMDLPNDLSNGLVLTSMRNLPPNTQEVEMPYLAISSKPRIVKLTISTEGEDKFRVGTLFQTTTKYVIKVKLGGVTGAVAPMIGQQPPDFHVWVTRGVVPTVIRVDGPLYEGGPIWSSELASAVW